MYYPTQLWTHILRGLIKFPIKELISLSIRTTQSCQFSTPIIFSSPIKDENFFSYSSCLCCCP